MEKVTVESLLKDLPTEKIEYLPIITDPQQIILKKPIPTGSFGPLPMRTGYDKLLYGCGVAYLAGVSYGGVYGIYRGLQTAKVASFKVRMNSVLNQMTRYGPWAANSLGVMSMSWALLDNGMQMVRGTSDYYNHVGAAFLSGFIFKSTAGIRPAFIAGSILASIVSSFGLYDEFSKR